MFEMEKEIQIFKALQIIQKLNIIETQALKIQYKVTFFNIIQTDINNCCFIKNLVTINVITAEYGTQYILKQITLMIEMVRCTRTTPKDIYWRFELINATISHVTTIQVKEFTFMKHSF